MPNSLLLIDEETKLHILTFLLLLWLMVRAWNRYRNDTGGQD